MICKGFKLNLHFWKDYSLLAITKMINENDYGK